MVLTAVVIVVRHHTVGIIECVVACDSGSLSKEPNLTEDDDVFKHLALVYARKHPTMHKGKACPNNYAKDTFPKGIVNGAEWYPLTGLRPKHRAESGLPLPLPPPNHHLPVPLFQMTRHSAKERANINPARNPTRATSLLSVLAALHEQGFTLHILFTEAAYSSYSYVALSPSYRMLMIDEVIWECRWPSGLSLDFGSELEIAQVQILSETVAIFISTTNLVLYRLSPLFCLIRSSHRPVAHEDGQNKA
ncbi:hypothetical protein J6590_092764 [Homalodisca vitripennis]|nr:hypothetical protein J6590_092764 [Homalodisca vitripennis]